MRPPSAALSRLAVLPAAALTALVTPALTSSHSTHSAHAVPAMTPVASVQSLVSDVPASHATTAHQEALRQQFFAAVKKAQDDAALTRYYEGVQRARDEAAQRARDAAAQQARDAALARFYANAKPAAPVVVAQQQTTSAAPSSATNLNWSALAACESSGNPQAVSSGGYMGLYQFDQRTWESVGGSGSPLNASSAEQTLRAQILYSQRGSSPWPVCGSRLFS